MISFDEALAAVLAHARPLGTEEIKLEAALGAVLSRAVDAPSDLPLFDNSAVDGFGVRVADVAGASPDSPKPLRLAATIRAGAPATGVSVPGGTAVKILTGATVPAGVEAVVMKEYADESNEVVAIQRSAKPGENIRRKGEEFGEGDPVIPAGIRITPPVVGLLATLGCATCEAYKCPKVGVVVTGNELIAPGVELQPGQIYDSNSYALRAVVNELGITDCRVVHTRDEKQDVVKCIAEALENSDVLITVGGISVGDYDYVKEVFHELAVETVFWKVAMKPGKPNYFGTYAADRRPGSSKSVETPAPKKLVFGLPGNPVSALVSFHELVKPALLKTMGLEATEPLTLDATLATEIRKKAGRVEFVRAVAASQDGKLVVKPTVGQGSHMLGGLADANCIIHVPAEAEHIDEGRQVAIQFITWRG